MRKKFRYGKFETNDAIPIVFESFSYDKDTGSLKWIERPERHFASKRTQDRSNKIHVGKEAGNLIPTGYLKVILCGLELYVHRIAWLMHYGEWPDGYIDHINGNSLDNSIGNLRIVTTQENALNRPIQDNNTSGVPGVVWLKRQKRWCARVKKNRKLIYLGVYVDKFEAICARKSGENRYGFHENHGMRASYKHETKGIA